AALGWASRAACRAPVRVLPGREEALALKKDRKKRKEWEKQQKKEQKEAKKQARQEARQRKEAGEPPVKTPSAFASLFDKEARAEEERARYQGLLPFYSVFDLDHAPGSATVLLLAAAAPGFSALISVLMRYRLYLFIAVTGPVACLALLMLLPATRGKALRGGSLTTAALFCPITVYLMATLAAENLAGRNFLHVSENCCTLLSCAALLVALYAEVRLRAGYLAADEAAALFTAAAVFCTALLLPAVLYHLLPWVPLYLPAPLFDLTNLLLLPLLWHRRWLLVERGDRLQPLPLGVEGDPSPDQQPPHADEVPAPDAVPSDEDPSDEDLSDEDPRSDPPSDQSSPSDR
ncbi:MAG: hypothetical protein IJC43_01595, partial [Clostridia bacterium]|nr:hypothetical protein [Clostridia bacterium]